MIIATSDVNIDLFAKRYPLRVLLYAACLFFEIVAQAFDNGVCGARQAHKNEIKTYKRVMGFTILLLGLLLYLTYWRQRKRGLHRQAFSFSIYGYLLAWGCIGLGNIMSAYFVGHHKPTAGGVFFAAVHLGLPLLFLSCRAAINQVLGRHWLVQRKMFGAADVAADQGISPQHGSMAAVNEALAAKPTRDLNALLRVGEGGHDEFSLLTLACFNGHTDAVEALLRSREVRVNQSSRHQQWTPLFAAAMNGHASIVAELLFHGADPHAQTESGENALLVATANGHTQVIRQLLDVGASVEMQWMGITAADAARALERDSAFETLRAYESHFGGHISEARGCKCVASWPGIYAKEWDQLVAQARKGEVSAAVVFLPENTSDYGAHGSDRCFCQEMYGEIKPWGCRWFELWRAHIEKAVEREQQLQVIFFAEHAGRGKVSSWDEVAADARRRDSFQPRRQQFIESLPEAQHTRLRKLSTDAGTSKALPRTSRSERTDEEERLFLSSLSTEEAAFLQAHAGLGNSQKAEVAWLEKRYKETGNVHYLYEEVDVRDFRAAT
eukprot:g1244.t1